MIMMPSEQSRIAIINEDPYQLTIITDVLKEDDLDIMTFGNAGKFFMEAPRSNLPDLIIISPNQSTISPWRFSRILRSRIYAEFNAIPIMIMSAAFLGDDKKQITTEVGDNVHLFIPYKPIDLKSYVQALLIWDGAGQDCLEYA